MYRPPLEFPVQKWWKMMCHLGKDLFFIGIAMFTMWTPDLTCEHLLQHANIKIFRGFAAECSKLSSNLNTPLLWIQKSFGVALWEYLRKEYHYFMFCVCMIWPCLLICTELSKAAHYQSYKKACNGHWLSNFRVCKAIQFTSYQLDLSLPREE